MKSVLIGIIERLQVMTKASEPEVRRFELDGVEKCQVTYYPSDKAFELSDSERDTQYRFDNLDLVAIEIYELLG